MGPFHPPLGALLGSLGCTWSSLGTLWDAVWSLRADLAQPECHSTPLGGPLPPIQLPHRLWSTPAALLGATSALMGRGRCQFGVDKWLRQKKVHFWKKFCPRQRTCPRQVACSKKVICLRKSSAPGREAAPDKWLVQEKHFF